MVLPVGTVGVTGVVGAVGGRVVGAVGVRNPYLSSELPDRPETTFIPFLVSSSPCSTPLVIILASPLVSLEFFLIFPPLTSFNVDLYPPNFYPGVFSLPVILLAIFCSVRVRVRLFDF